MPRTLLESYEGLVGAIQTMNCGLLVRDAPGRIVFMNQRLLSWLGYEAAEVVGKELVDFFPPELRELARADIDAASAGDVRARLAAMQRKDSTTFPVIGLPHRLLDDHGVYLGNFTILVDLGAVLTAKQVGTPTPGDLRSTLTRIAIELQSISLAPELPAIASIPMHHPELAGLSPRETEVLSLLVSGGRVPAIASQLHISQHTVRNHLKSVYRKVGVRTQSELIERVRSLAGATDASSGDVADSAPTPTGGE
ncbi:MAG: PAS and helix-turn-helix domain-containing protein [Proteobacteria bacterium]|nr:PAS and helix-turn-helix domain-containing protein [Pseudomonadota bacterium]MCZ6785252.1 PAS and helix-turn-helix domain-containing protein [Pseudomonadota bacterium]